MADFSIKQGDTSPAIQSILQDQDGNAINLSGASVRFLMYTAYSQELVKATATIVDAANGTVKYEWVSGDTDVLTSTPLTTGDPHVAEWEVTYSDGTIETFPNDGYLLIEVYKDLD